MNIVIAGFGVAGATAAETARKANPGAYITLFSQEKDLFYYRTRLPEVVSGEVALEKLVVHPKSWYQERNIELRVSESLVEINHQSQSVRGSLGSRLPYDRLLLAVGAEANRLSFPGDQQAGIFAVRSLMDAWNLSIYAKGKSTAVLIGCGLLGLEMAFALTKLGLKVKALELADRVLPRQTTPASAAVLEKKLASKGIDFLLGVSAKQFDGQGHVESVVLSTGETLPADVAIISAGVTPNTILGEVVGLKIDRGIVVDQYMETSQPGIFAAGDCASFPGAVGGLWTTSRQQALIAGHNIAATSPEARKTYLPEPPSNILKVAGVDLVAAGQLDVPSGFKGLEAQNGDAYRLVVVDADHRLAGFTNVGTTQGNKELNAALAGRRQLSPESLDGLHNFDFDFSKL